MLDSHTRFQDNKNSDKSHIKPMQSNGRWKSIYSVYLMKCTFGFVCASVWWPNDWIFGRILNKSLFSFYFFRICEIVLIAMLIDNWSDVVHFDAWYDHRLNCRHRRCIYYGSAVVLNFCSCCSHKHITTQWINKLLNFIQESKTLTHYYYYFSSFTFMRTSRYMSITNEKTRLFLFECV